MIAFVPNLELRRLLSWHSSKYLRNLKIDVKRHTDVQVVWIFKADRDLSTSPMQPQIAAILFRRNSTVRKKQYSMPVDKVGANSFALLLDL
jgi:hypothetical protein